MPILTSPIVSPMGPIMPIYVWIGATRQQSLAQNNQVPPPAVPVQALVDTGASSTCVDEAIVGSLGLSPTGVVAIRTPSTGTAVHQCYQYDMSIWLLPPGLSAFHNVALTLPVIATQLASQSIGALIGRDVLSRWLMVYNGREGNFTIATE